MLTNAGHACGWNVSPSAGSRSYGRWIMSRVAWNKGLPASPEHREHNRLAHLGKPGWNKGIPCSEETKHKISLAHKGKPLSEEHKAKLSAAGKGRTFTEEHKAKMRASLVKTWAEGRRHFSNFSGRPHRWVKGHEPWNTGMPDNPGLARIRELPHGMLGKHLTDEHKVKISAGRKGKYRHFGVKNPFFGHRHSEALKERRRQKWTGVGNPTYRDGASEEKYPIAFSRDIKKAIRQRDDYICQLCGALECGKAHNVHHIDYNKFNNGLSNFVTLCVGCNSRVNIHRDGWQMYFRDLLVTRGIVAEGLPKVQGCCTGVLLQQ